MLTEEQIKKLKPGDPLVVQCEFHKAYNNGDISVKHKVLLNGEDRCTHTFTHPSCASLPSEHGTSVPTTKHDPCRLFREGDEVRVVERYGREMPFCNYINSGEVYTVARDEKDGIVALFTCDGTDCTSWYWLELVTPVEELEPYSIDPANTNVLFKRGKKFATFEDDDEAQELCDRLNAEWRKEQNND